ncbi:MAG: SusC/RagA family TonB-linked outer membrane protein [Cytophagales bacterium]|nr:SusC/RagA family TonB-linked outer membrane protein [Cytophagales bacterium]
MVKGTVTDKEDGSPLIGVTVVEVGANGRFINGTQTDYEGNYSLKVTSPGNKIQFSYIGYNTVVQVIGDRMKIDLALQADTQTLDEVEIVADKMDDNGFMKMKNKATAVSQISMSKLQDVQAMSATDALQGRISNVDIVADSGDPGAGVSIRIRGASSIMGNSQPLIVIDDIPYEPIGAENFDFKTSDVTQYGSLIDIAPNDIEEISIAKDAASAARWGAKAANGVVMIRTKSGVKSKPKFSYNVKLTLDQQPRSIPMLNGPDYVLLMKDARFNLDGEVMDTNFDELAYRKDWEYYHEYNQNTDWVDAVTQTGFNQNHSFSVQGGGDKAKYYVSFDYQNRQGTTIGTGNKKYSSLVKLDYDLSTKLRFHAQLKYLRDNVDNNLVNIRSRAFAAMPNMSIYERDEEGNPTDIFFTPRRNYQGNSISYNYDNNTVKYEQYNPVALAELGSSRRQMDRITSNMQLRYQPAEWLQYRGLVAFDIASSKFHSFLPSKLVNSTWTDRANNVVGEQDADDYVIRTSNRLLATPERFSGHKFSYLLDFQTNDYLKRSYGSGATNIPYFGMDDVSGSYRLKGISSRMNASRDLGIVHQLYYDFKERYMVNFSLRSEASSKFGDNNRWGHFPAGGLAWRVSNEPFLSGWEFLTDWKFRGSWGQTGGAPGASYSDEALYRAGKGYLNWGDVSQHNIRLVNLQWATTTELDLGMDMSLFDDRLNFKVDYYSKETAKQIFPKVGIPSSTGFSNLMQNYGTMSNKGLEMELFAMLVDKKDLKVSFDFNIARNQNTVEEMPSNFSFVAGNPFNSGEYMRRVEIGDPIGSFYGYRYLGVYSTDEDAVAKDASGKPIKKLGRDDEYVYMRLGDSRLTPFKGGDAIYEDVNHDGIINELDIVYLGSSNPDVTGGFTPRVTYRNLTLRLSFHYRLGQQVVNMTRLHMEKMSKRDNQSKAVLRRWRRPGDVTDVPRALYENGYNTLGSDRFVEDADYVRLKSLSMNYNFGRKFLDRLGLEAMQLTFTARNLYTWTDYTGQDPEVKLRGKDPFFVGVDNGRTPPAKSYVMGLRVIL